MSSKSDGFGTSGGSIMRKALANRYRSGLEEHCFVIGSIGVFYDGEVLIVRLINMQGKWKGERE